MKPLRVSRRRGVILSLRGQQKLQEAKRRLEVQVNFGDRYTLEDLSARTGLSLTTVTKVLEAQVGVDRQTLDCFFTAFNLHLERGDYSQPGLCEAVNHQPSVVDQPYLVQSKIQNPSCAESAPKVRPKIQNRTDWGEAIDVSFFLGRSEELTTLRQWLQDGCHLIALLGMGGIGKTALSVKLAEQTQDQFEYLIWRSLRSAPPIQELLASLIQFLSDQQVIASNLPKDVNSGVSQLIEYLRSSRCLLVLDNVETILCSGEHAGHYRQGYEGYGELLRRVGESRHQSCLVLTSREKPKEFSSLEGETLPVRSMQLTGLTVAAGQEIFKAKGSFSGAENEWKAVVEHYAGNPLALKMVATCIQALFAGNVAEFLASLNQRTLVFDDISDLLERQFNRLSELEKEVMYWLAIEREPVSLLDLREDLLSSVSRQKLSETLRSLGQRSLTEKKLSGFTQQPVVMEYITDQLIERVCQEVITGETNILNSHALIKAQAKDYVRDMQVRLILKPVIDKLFTTGNKRDTESLFSEILSTLRSPQLPTWNSASEGGELLPEPGYAGGNILNLLSQLQTDLSGYDFSHLTIRQAYLKGVDLHHVNFAHSNLAKSVFTETLSITLSVAFSPNGKLLATGGADGEVRLWQVADGKKLLTLKGHTSWIWSVAFSPDGQTLASGSDDHTVRLWDISTGKCCCILQGHASQIWSVAFSPDGQTLASGSEDRTVRLWNVRTGECYRTLQGHTSWVRSVAYAPNVDYANRPNYQILASSSDDCTVKLWNVHTGQCYKTLEGHTSQVWSIAFSPNGQTLASGSSDQTVKLWNILTGECYQSLQGHTSWVRSVAFSPNGQIASGSEDHSVRLWDISTGECYQSLQGHTSWVRSVAYAPNPGYANSPDSQILASGSGDHTVKLWDVNSGRCCKTFQGHTSRVWSVAFTPVDNRLPQGISPTLASGNDDHTVKLWDRTGKCYQTLQGHTNWVCSVAFSPVGASLPSGISQILASGSSDHTVKLWNIHTGECYQTLQGHTSRVWSVAFSPDGQTLASGSDDQTVRLWNVSTGECYQTLSGHTNWVCSVAFSPNGQTLASGSYDQTVRLWNVSTGEYQTLRGHANWVWTVAFSPNGQTLASGSGDHTVKLWDIRSGECYQTLQGHTSRVWSIAFSSDGQTLASGSSDHTVKLWNMHTGECYQTLQGHSNLVWSVAFSSIGASLPPGISQVLASGSQDETIKLWDIKTGKTLQTLRADRPYEHMNITGTAGLTEAQKATLKALGAEEDEKMLHGANVEIAAEHV